MVSVIAKSLRDRRQYQALTDIFEKADVSGNGRITIADYINICLLYGIDVTKDELRNVEALADANGEVTKSDFIQYVKQSNMFKSFESVDPESDHHWNRKVELAWKVFDKNMDGYISKTEFGWMTNKSKLSKEQIDAMYARCDLDGDGYLDFDEFKRLIFRSRERKEAFKIFAEDPEKPQKLSKDQLNTYLAFKKTTPKYSVDSIQEKPEEEIETDEDIAEELEGIETNEDSSGGHLDKKDFKTKVGQSDESFEIPEDMTGEESLSEDQVDEGMTEISKYLLSMV